MRLIENLSADPRQNVKVVLEDGSIVDITLRYFETQRGWFYDIQYGTFINYNRRLVTSPNMLRQFRDILPFGIACVVNDGKEPVFLDDFSTKRVVVYFLTAEEVLDVETRIISV